MIRYRHPGVRARITPQGDGSVQVAFATPQSAVAPGQAVAFYDGDRVLGGGWIEARMKNNLRGGAGGFIGKKNSPPFGIAPFPAPCMGLGEGFGRGGWLFEKPLAPSSKLWQN